MSRQHAPSTATAAGELAKKKEELLDLVSGFLLKEPKFQNTGAAGGFDKTGLPVPLSGDNNNNNNVEGDRDNGNAEHDSDEEVDKYSGDSSTDGGTSTSSSSSSRERHAKRSDAEDTVVHQVERLRQLVHDISLSDAEFCLKTALYLRQELNIRQTANFLCALCAREPKCQPFLGCYLERVIVLPSDWLSVANFAYFFDNDYEHQKWDIGRKRERAKRQRERLQLYKEAALQQQQQQQHRNGGRGRDATGGGARDKHIIISSSPSRSARKAPEQQQRRRTAAELADLARVEEEEKEVLALKKRVLPSCLRRCLVEIFASFDEFSLAKYNNENAEKKKRKRAREKHEEAVNAMTSLSDSDDKTSGKSDGIRADAVKKEDAEEGGRCTFTYKQLIRLLHIAEPAYEVCCILGQRYPKTKAEFDEKFNKNASSSLSECGGGKEPARRDQQQQQQQPSPRPPRVFEPAKAGTRMRLLLPDTWETLIAAKGNRGAVWDELVSNNRLPFMATMRNLRNLTTRNCASATHEAVLARLQSEEQVARSKQLPYRFFSAYTAVGESLADREATAAWLAARSKFKRANRKTLSGEELRTQMRKRCPFPRKVGRVGVKQCECPLLRTEAEHKVLVEQYKDALNVSVAIAARLNVIPMKGTSLVILTLSWSMLENLRAAGGPGGNLGSVRTKLDVAALLAVMMRHSCEMCIVVIFAYGQYVVYDGDDGLAHSPRAHRRGSEESGIGSESCDAADSTGTPTTSTSTSDEEDSGSGGNGDGDVAKQNVILREVELLVETCRSMLRCSHPPAQLLSPWRARPDIGSAFPFPILDQVIERRTELASLMVIDDDGHHTYRGMNTAAPALGDLPVYLSRLRRTCSPNVVYVGVALAAPSRSDLGSGHAVPLSAEAEAKVRVPVEWDVMADERDAKERFLHRNDILLTGFSDAILRLVAERMNGGAVAAVERADATYKVNRGRARLAQTSDEERRKALSWLRHVEEQSRRRVLRTLPPEFRGQDKRDAKKPGEVRKEDQVAEVAATVAATVASPVATPTTAEVRRQPLCSSSVDELRRMGDGMRQARVQFVVPSTSVNGEWEDPTLRATGTAREEKRATATEAVMPAPATAAAATDGQRWRWSPAPTQTQRLKRELLSHAHGIIGERDVFGRGDDGVNGNDDDDDDDSETGRDRDDEGNFRSRLLMGSDTAGGSSIAAPFEMKRTAPPPTTVIQARFSLDVDDGERFHTGPETQQGKRTPLTIYHPTSFITLSQASGGAEGAITLKYALRSMANRRRHANHAVSSSSAAPSAAARPVEGITHSATPLPTEGRGTKSAPRDTGFPHTSSTTTATTMTTAGPHSHVPAKPTTKALPIPEYYFRECRFFISSTFLDMNNERNALTLDVFPRIRRWAAERGIKVTVVEVDLRWGITEMSTNENLSTSVCLNEVSRCAPFFLGILGSRYGSCPSPLQIVADEDVPLADYAWLSEIPPDMENKISVTELEMRHGVHNAKQRWRQILTTAGSTTSHAGGASKRGGGGAGGGGGSGNDDDSSNRKTDEGEDGGAVPPPGVIFLHRDYDHLLQSLPADERRTVYEPDTPQTQERIARLRAFLHAEAIPVVEYKARFCDLSAPPTTTTAPSASHKDAGSAEGNAGVAAAAAAVAVAASAAAMLTSAGTVLPEHEWSTSRAITSGAAFASATAAAFPGLPPLPVAARRSGSPRGSTPRNTATEAAAVSSSTYRDTGRFLTSQDVLLDMDDFAAKAFAAIQQAILGVCGNRRRTDGDEAEEEAEKENSAATEPCDDLDSVVTGRSDSSSNGLTLSPATASPSPAATAAATAAFVEPRNRAAAAARQPSAGFYATHVEDAARYAADLCKLYVPPTGLIGELASFAMGFAQDRKMRGNSGKGGSKKEESGPRDHAGMEKEGHRPSTSTGSPATTPAWRLTGNTWNGAGAAAAEAGLDAAASPDRVENGGVLVLQAGDSDGKSSALALLARQLAESDFFANTDDTIVYYTSRASDGSLRGLLLFLVLSLLYQCGLHNEFHVSESEATANLLDLLPRVYEAVKKREKSALVILDGLEQSPEAEEIVKHMGTIVNPLATPEVRFLLSSTPLSPLAVALQARMPPAQTVTVPALDWPERAEVVRKHLANYGKRLQESAINVNELKGLLRKRGAALPSYLTSAMTYLRLFSTFDTLRNDIRRMPSSTAQLYVEFVRELERRFGAETCRLVLTTLYLWQAVGGVMEYNLYRLVSHVAAASRLVALLTGTCIISARGRLLIGGSFFATAIAQSYLRSPLDRRQAYETMVAAELLYRPLTALRSSSSAASFSPAAADPWAAPMTRGDDGVGVAVPATAGTTTATAAAAAAAAFGVAVDSKTALRAVMESIRANAADPSSPCLFRPERYAPRELLSLLSSSLLAGRADVATALVCYLPYLENLLKNATMLQRLISLLSQLLRLCENEKMKARVSSVVGFLHTNYHILCARPDLICQCRLNAPAEARALSRYDSAVVARLSGSDRPLPDTTVTPQHQQERRKKASAAATAELASPSSLSPSWIRWNNLDQHGGAARIFTASPTTSPILCMAVDPDSNLVALGCADHLLRVAPTDGPEHQVASLKHSAAVTAVRFLPRLAQATAARANRQGGGVGNTGDSDDHSNKDKSDPSGSNNSSGSNRRGGSGGERGGSLARQRTHQGGQDMADPVNHQQILVSGCERGLFYVWCVDDGTLLQVGSAHLRTITRITCHPVENVVCTSGEDTYCVLWNVLGAESNMSSALRAHVQAVLQRTEDAARQLGETRNGANDGKQRGCSQMPEEELQRRASVDRALKAKLRQLRTYNKTPAASLSRFALSRLGEEQTALHPFSVLRHSQTPVAAIAYHQAGEILATGSWDGTVCLIYTSHLAQSEPDPAENYGTRQGTTAEEQLRLPYEYQTYALAAPVRAVCFAPSSIVTCAVGTWDGAITLIDQAAGLISATLTTLHHSPITALAYSPDGQFMASADAHGIMKITYAGVNGTELCSLSGHRGTVTGLCFTTSRDEGGSLALLSSSADLTVQAWAVRPDNAAAAAASSRTARFEATGRQETSATAVLRNSHTSTVTCVAAASDARCFVTGCSDGVAYVFTSSPEATDMAARGVSTHGSPQRRMCTRRRLPSYRFGSGDNSNNSRSGSDQDGDDEEEEEASFDPNVSMQPSFTLWHNGCRVSALTFALHDTRIVAGVAFGHVYVWASTPGLNQREGRLLQRVRVPSQGLFPVVSLQSDELEDTMARLRERQAQWQKRAGDARDGPAPPGNAEERGRAMPLPASAQVTALCSNGDTARFCVYADSVSVALLREGIRRHKREQARAAQRHSTRGDDKNPHHEDNTLHEDEDGSSTADDRPLASRSSSSSSGRGGTSRCSTPVRRSVAAAQGRRQSMSAALTHAVEHEAHLLARQPVAMREAEDFPVERSSLAWFRTPLAHHSAAGREGGKEKRRGRKEEGKAIPLATTTTPVPTTGEEIVSTLPLHFCCHVRLAEKRPYESGGGGGSGSGSALVLDWADRGVFTADSPLHRNGKIMGSSGDNNNNKEKEEDLVVNLANRTSGSAAASLSVGCHHSLVIGQRTLYLASHGHHHEASSLPITFPSGMAQQAEGVLAGDLALGPDEVVTCASPLVKYGCCTDRGDRNGDGSGGGGSSNSSAIHFSGLFAIATSEGRLLVLHIRYRHDGTRKDTAGQDVRVELVYASLLLPNRNDDRKALIGCLALSLSAAATGRCRCRGHAHPTLRVIAGCADTTVRVLTLDLSDSLVNSPLPLTTTASAGRDSGAVVRTAAGEPYRSSPSRAPASPPSPPLPPLALPPLRLTLREENVFYATAPLSALSVLVPCPRTTLFAWAASTVAQRRHEGAERGSQSGHGKPLKEEEDGEMPEHPERTMWPLPPPQPQSRAYATFHNQLLNKVQTDPALLRDGRHGRERGGSSSSSGRDPVRRANELVWVAGDCLGNIYQLHLESEDEFVARLEAMAAQDEPLPPLLPSAVAEHFGDGAVGSTDEDLNTLMQLRRRHRQAANMGRDVYSITREKLLTAGSFSREELFGAALAPSSTSGSITAAHVDAVAGEKGGVALRGWAWQSGSPFEWLRPVDFTAQPLVQTPIPTTTTPSARGKEAAAPAGLLSELDVYNVKKSTATYAPSSSPSIYAFLDELDARQHAQPAPLPSLYTEEYGKDASREFALLPNISFSAGRRKRSARSREDGNHKEGSMGATNGRDTQSKDVADPSPVPTAPTVPATSYFAILTQRSPADAQQGTSPEQRKAWVKRRHTVLKEAMRVQHYNAEARAAVDAYNTEILSHLSV